MQHLPPDAREALVDFAGALGRYQHKLEVLSEVHVEPPHPSFDELHALLLDVEQALIRIFRACFVSIEQPEGDEAA